MLLVACSARKDKVVLRLEPLRTDNGWGYRISSNGRPLISQRHIPVVAGYRSFRSEEDAMRVGRLVMYKLKQRLSPAVTARELDSLRIR